MDRPIIQSPIYQRDVRNVYSLKEVRNDPHVLEATRPVLQPIRPGCPVTHEEVALLPVGGFRPCVDLSCRHPWLGPQLQSRWPRWYVLEGLPQKLYAFPHLLERDVSPAPTVAGDQG